MYNASRIFSGKTHFPNLVILVKEPKPGLIKTRLAKDYGKIKATWWYRHESRKTINRLGRDPRWETFLAVSPDHEGLKSRIWPENIWRIPQGRGHLGERMKHVFQQLYPGPTVIIGSDIPGIEPSQIARSFYFLGKYDAYVGPSPDGGFWLIGLKGKKVHSTKMFDNVRWSSEFALEDTISSMGKTTLGMGEVMSDVDTLSDLRANPHSKV